MRLTLPQTLLQHGFMGRGCQLEMGLDHRFAGKGIQYATFRLNCPGLFASVNQLIPLCFNLTCLHDMHQVKSLEQCQVELSLMGGQG
jgi:hypothetical protein|tara:strand:- start:69 stop:329 length:261 start_codon:yes stop_codon:yes gene_type:complete